MKWHWLKFDFNSSTEKKVQPPLPPRKSEEKVIKKPVTQQPVENKPQKGKNTQASKGNVKTGKETGSKVINEQKVVADLAKKQDHDNEMEETLKGLQFVVFNSLLQ